MKALPVNILFLVGWTLLGSVFGMLSFMATFMAFPLLFIVSAYYIKYNLPGYIVIPFSFLILLINDYLFRIFGGGNHDDAGRAWCELIFYCTLFTAIITMFFIAYRLSYQNNNVIKKHWLYNSILVVVCSALSYLIFSTLNKYI